MASFGRARRQQTSGFLRSFAALFLVSATLLVLRDSDPVRGASTFATQLLIPIQRVTADVGAAGNRVAQAIGEIETLRADNEALRADNERLVLENIRLREAAVAASQAARLREIAGGLPYESVAAPVIARDPSNILATIVLGAGTEQGVRLGHVVVSEQGLVGRVSEVGTNYAKVLLITDPSHTLSALVEGSRATGIVRGQYGDSLVMDWILQTEPVKPGDVVVTAGLGLGEELRSLYPKGLVVGRVAQVQNAQAAAYVRAIVVPAVDLRKLENVLVVKTSQ
jgi:rod shape-determining protein MreC